MRAEVYKITVCEGVVDMVHGGGSDIIELYIPSKKIAFNETNDSFHCFITKKDRYSLSGAIKMGEIEIPKAILQAMTDCININKRLSKTKKWYKRCVLSGNFAKVKNRKKRKK